MDRSFPPNVITNAFGLSNQSGQGKILVDTMSLYEKNQTGNDTTSQNHEFIHLSTIDKYCQEHKISQIDFLKIDTEGHDLFVLRGASEMIEAEQIKRIQFEYSAFNIYSRTMLRDFFSFFQDRPYSIFQIMPKGLREIPIYDFSLENFIYKNFAVLHHSVNK
ncbi:MAG: FkbM family methyltransferase [Saprospiraceae bacterium]|nr:FkbM family methyltransferase [Saprospiraceae bacterium]